MTGMGAPSMVASVAGLVDFSTGDGSNLGTTVVDGQGNSDDIVGIEYQIVSAANDGTPNNAAWIYYIDTNVGQDGIVTGNYDPLFIIKSADGAEFSFEGVSVGDYLGFQSEVTFEGFRDSVSTGSVTLEINRTSYHEIFDTSDLTPSAFQYVDEVRITNPNDYDDGIDNYGKVNQISLDELVFGDPVMPNSPPMVDANGATGGTAHTTTFTEDSGTVRIVASDATLTDDGDLTSVTLALAATPDDASEEIAYDASLNGDASLVSLGLVGGYDSGTRTFTASGTADQMPNT